MAGWLIVTICFILFLIFRRRTDQKRVPPGSSPFAIIRNILRPSSESPIESFRKLRQKFGDVFRLPMVGTPTFVINGLPSIRKVLIDNGDTTSFRPSNVFFTDIYQRSGIIGSDGSLWAIHRRFAVSALGHLGFGKRVMESRIKIEIKALVEFIEKTKGEPFDLTYCGHACTSNIIFSIVLGKRFDYDDSDLHQVLHQQDNILRSVKWITLVDTFPFLKFLPGDIFCVKEISKNVRNIEDFFLPFVREHNTPKHPQDVKDYIGAYLYEQRKQGEEAKDENGTFTEFQLIRTLAQFLEAGMETTSSTIFWAFVLFLHNEDVVLKMKEEIDNVVGHDSLPCLDDKKNLPYSQAVITEIVRFSGVAPFGAPHRNVEEFDLNGYTIPKNSTLIMNLGSVLRDPNLFEEPETFNPSRFLDESGQFLGDENVLAFGFGKRVCIGEALAKMELFLIITALVQQFEIKPEDPDQLPHLQGRFDVTHTPQKYKVRLIKRSTVC